ncbi:MAG: outer membrane protein assembly factor BamD [Planctomycetes bacterium]|nr:outer membrane protein assembly factor BamD [Planctomycetota bacterium]
MSSCLVLIFLLTTVSGGDQLTDLLIQARDALEQGHYEEAVTLYEDSLELALYGDDDEPTEGPLLARIRLGLAESYRASRNNDEALRVTELIFESDPGSETLDRALEIRYEIGISYLNGATRRLLGLEVSAERKGLDVLSELVERYPFQPFSDDAIFHCANWYLKNKLPKDGERLFARLLREYPNSSWAAPTQILIGDALLAQIKGIEYDFGPLSEAERHYRRYLRLFPNQGDGQRARIALQKIQIMKAQRRLLVADFYIRIEKFESARVYLERIILDVPSSEEALRARKILEEILPKEGGES